MLFVRFLVFVMLGASALCFVFYLGTGRPGYRRWGLALLKWTLIAALGFFGVLAVQQFF